MSLAPFFPVPRHARDFLWALSRCPRGQVCGCLWFISAEISQAASPSPSYPLTLPGWRSVAMRWEGTEKEWEEVRCCRGCNAIWQCVGLWLMKTYLVPSPAIEKHRPASLPPCIHHSSYIFGYISLLFFPHLPRFILHLCWLKKVWRTCTYWSWTSGLFALLFFWSVTPGSL